MKLTDIIIAVVALILAYFLIRTLLAITFFVIKMAVILIIAYIIYLFLKTLL